MTTQPSRSARFASSRTRRDFPMPASPPNTTTPPSPRMADSSESSRTDSSDSRPLKAGQTTLATAIPGPLAFLSGLFSLAQPPAERLKEAVRDLGVAAEKLPELALRDSRRDQVGAGRDVRAAALLVEERHLAEVVAWAEKAVPAVDSADLRLAFEDDHETNAILAPQHWLDAFRVANLAHLLAELLQVAIGHLREQTNGLQVHRSRFYPLKRGASGSGAGASARQVRNMAARDPACA